MRDDGAASRVTRELDGTRRGDEPGAWMLNLEDGIVVVAKMGVCALGERDRAVEAQ